MPINFDSWEKQAGIVIGIVASLITPAAAIQAWLDRRSRMTALRRKFDLINAELETIQKWFEAAKQSAPDELSSEKKQVTARLRLIANNLTALTPPPANAAVKPEDFTEPAIPWLTRFTLWFKPRSAGGWIARAFFYPLLLLSLLMAVGLFADPQTSLNTKIAVELLFSLPMAIVYVAALSDGGARTRQAGDKSAPMS